MGVLVFLIKRVGVSLDRLDKLGSWNDSAGGVLDLLLSVDGKSSASVDGVASSDLPFVGLLSGGWDLFAGLEVEGVVDS